MAATHKSRPAASRQPPCILVTASIEERGIEFSDTSLSVSNRYPAALAAARGLPWVLPCIADAGFVRQAVAACDGVMLTGGDDIEPSLYADRPLPRKVRDTVKVADPKRDWVELLVIREVFRQRKPMLAICRGHQLLNVALGGSLVADLPLQRPGRVRHNRPDRKDRQVHPVSIESDSALASILGARTIGVNSTHHQAIDQLAPLLRCTARSPDGLVEALELAPDAAAMLPYLLSVQFHPERLVDRYPPFRRLFGSFIQACRTSRTKSE